MATVNENNNCIGVEHKLKLHPLDDCEFIGTITIPEIQQHKQVKSSAIETVIILDRSGSMGDSARRVANEILPLFLLKLSYEKLHQVHFITFESVAHDYHVSAERMKQLSVSANGSTHMAPAVKRCHELFKSFSSKSVRILTISDGEINDRPETDKAVAELIKFLKAQNFTINSQAVRLFTSKKQPDTAALCSLLQVNNSTTSQLTDICTSESNDAIASKLSGLFKSDNLLKGQSLTTESKTIFKFPWQSAPTTQLTLVPGENLLFFKEPPPTDIKVGDVPVKIEMQAPLTFLKFQALMEVKLFYIVDHMKILKVVGTEEANKTIGKIVEYFQQKEDTLAAKSPLVRFLNIKSVHRKKISNFLSMIAKNDTVKSLNSAQKADYLRGTGYTKENPTWAEQAAELGIDIDQVGTKSLVIILIGLAAIAAHKIFSH